MIPYRSWPQTLRDDGLGDSITEDKYHIWISQTPTFYSLRALPLLFTTLKYVAKKYFQNPIPWREFSYWSSYPHANFLRVPPQKHKKPVPNVITAEFQLLLQLSNANFLHDAQKYGTLHSFLSMQVFLTCLPEPRCSFFKSLVVLPFTALSWFGIDVSVLCNFTPPKNCAPRTSCQNWGFSTRILTRNQFWKDHKIILISAYIFLSLLASIFYISMVSNPKQFLLGATSKGLKRASKAGSFLNGTLASILYPKGFRSKIATIWVNF